MEVAKRNRKTDIQCIRDWYKDESGELKLTKHQEIKRKRILVAQSMLASAKPNSEIIEVLSEDFDISGGQAFRDVKDAIALYGDLRKAEKEGLRYIIYDMALHSYNTAKKDANVKGMNAAINNMTKLLGLDREEPDLPDFEKLEPSTYIITLDEEVREMFLAFINMGGSLDLTKLVNNAENASKAKQFEAIEPERVDKAGNSPIT